MAEELVIEGLAPAQAPQHVTNITYVAAPLRADTTRGRLKNLGRAKLLGRLLAIMGGWPIVPHLAVGGLWPNYPHKDDTPSERRMAMEHCIQLVQAVAMLRGQLVVLLRDDGTVSEGCAEEMRCYEAMRPQHPIPQYTWADFQNSFTTVGLGAQWRELK